MSGHSHWSTIKHKKAALDAKRGRAWSKLARNVTMAARIGGGNADMNPRLRLAIDKARADNMPKDTIEKAIKKGTGELEGVTYEEVVYEGFGPGGTAVMAQAYTDNRTRTSPEIKKIFERAGGNLGARGSVSHLFTQRGLFTVSKDVIEEERLLEIALECGADDVKLDGDEFSVTCDPSAFQDVKAALAQAEIATSSADVTMLPITTVTLDAESGRKILNLMDALDEHDDVQNVYSNFDLPDEVMKAIGE